MGEGEGGGGGGRRRRAQSWGRGSAGAALVGGEGWEGGIWGKLVWRRSNLCGVKNSAS
jgi:hypothetical protein